MILNNIKKKKNLIILKFISWLISGGCPALQWGPVTEKVESEIFKVLQVTRYSYRIEKALVWSPRGLVTLVQKTVCESL